MADKSFLFLFEHSSTPMWIHDRETLAVLAVNDSAVTVYGRARDEILALPLTDVLPSAMAQFLTEGGQPDRHDSDRVVVSRAAQQNGESIDAAIRTHDLVYDGRPARLVIADRSVDMRRAEAQRNQFFDVAPGLMCVVDLQGRFVSINPAWERLLGHPASELVSRPTLDFVHPADRPDTAAMLERLGAGELVHNFINRYICADGSYRWLEWRSIGVPDDAVAYGLARDITAERAALAELSAAYEREQRLALSAEMLAKAALAMNLSLDVQSMLDLVTTTARSVILTQEASTTFVPDGNWERAITAREVSEARAASASGDMWPAGSVIHLRVCEQNSPMRMTQEELEQDPDWRGAGAGTGTGSRMRGWLAAPLVGRDGRNLGLIQVSDRYHGELTAEDEAILVQLARMASVAIENADLHREILEREGRYRDLVNALEAIIWEADPVSMRYLYVSEQTSSVLGYAPDDWLQVPDLGLGCVHDDDKAAVREHLQAAADGDVAVIYEHRIARADGREVRLRTTVWASHAAAGRPGRLCGMSVDITEEHRRQEMLQSAEKLRALGQLAGGIAHDLNQSLTLIAGYGELLHGLLVDSAPDLEAIRHMTMIMTRAAYDGGESVSRLLTFARPQPLAMKESINVETLLRDAAMLTAPRWRDAAQAEGRTIELRIEVEGALVVDGVSSSLREVLTNLIFNAMDAMPHGGQIRLAARESEDTVIIEVADTGSGMPDSVRARVFEPFFTTKGAAGTGLGLAMVFAVMQQHHGQIDVDSAPEQGTQFHLTFPRPVIQDAIDRSAPATMDPGAPRSLRVLIVDDEVQLLLLLRLLLVQLGHTVTTAASGEQAIATLSAMDGACDLLISDLGLGDGMNGWELAAQAARLQARLPIMLVTGWGHGIDVDEARQRGIKAVLAKPYHMADLKRALVSSCAP